MSSRNQEIKSQLERQYEHGFVTDIEAYTLPPGIDENVVRQLSKIKDEPQVMLDWRLRA